MATSAVTTENRPITTVDKTVKKLLRVIVSLVTLETIEPAGV
ncbi:hypothetical protein LHEJCM1005_05970 [Lactobacillus helveticus]|nr:hypothetical protein LHEJCM1005_05970 [Lactobacillus helveticus]